VQQGFCRFPCSRRSGDREIGHEELPENAGMNRRAGRGGPQSDSERRLNARLHPRLAAADEPLMMPQFRRSILAYIKALIRLRRAAAPLGRPRLHPHHRPLRARLRGIEAASAFHKAAREAFKAALRARLSRRTAPMIPCFYSRAWPRNTAQPGLPPLQ
jgi:hypothetical protein